MRVLASFIAAILIILVTSQLVSAQKSICQTPIKSSTSGNLIYPSKIPASTIAGMTNRGRGSYQVDVSLCSTASSTSSGCSGSGYVAISNSSGCVIGFDTVLGRPAPLATGGFSVKYGSSMPGHTNDHFSASILCDSSSTASASLSSKSKKFATMTPNKNGGTTYMVVLYSSVACGSSPLPPSPPSGKAVCKPFTLGRTSVNPSSWQPFFVLLIDGSYIQNNFLFALCDNKPTVPSWAPACNTPGYITMFGENTCASWTFDQLTSFTVDAANKLLTLTYSSSGSKNTAVTTVGCLPGVPGITSLGGTYTNQTNSQGGLQFNFQLQSGDMCEGETLAPWTIPPRPASLSGSSSVTGPPAPSNSDSGSNNHGGSGSMNPSGNPGSGSGVPSGPASGGSQPSGGSSDMPSGGSMSNSDMPSGGSMSNSDMPSGGSMSNSDMPSGGSGPSGEPSGDSGMPSGF